MAPPIGPRSPEYEKAFQAYTKQYGVRNPDDPRQHYDYRTAFEHKISPIKNTNLPFLDRFEDNLQVELGLRRPIPLGSYMWPDKVPFLDIPLKTEGHEVPIKKARQASLPPGVEVPIDISRIIQIESSGNPKALNKRSGARGLTQVIEGTWGESVKRMRKDWSWDDAFDPDKNKAVGSYYMNQRIPEMLNYYNLPDTVETRIAAYNWGIGNLLKAYNKHGAKWQGAIPIETRDYIRKYQK